MSTTVREDAEKALAEVEALTTAILPVPVAEIVLLDAAPADKADEIRRRMDEVDLTNTQSIISFGSAAQAELQVISQEMLQGVKNKDVGPAGDACARSSPPSAAFHPMNWTFAANPAGGTS
jgi:uncharacterized protein YaaN involved in tellurite resistance